MTDDAARGAGREGKADSDLPLSRPPRRSSSPASTRTRLTRLLITKAVAEAFFVLALALSFYYSNLYTRLSGAIESADGQRLTGWVVDEGDPSANVEVQLFIDGRLAASTVARERTDRTDGSAAGRRYFTFELSAQDAGEHEARAYAVTGGDGRLRTLCLIGKPVRFSARPGPVGVEQARSAEAGY